jgi:uncharacterized protein (TIGR02646 family)
MRKQSRPVTPKILEDHAERWNQKWVELRRKNLSASFSWYQQDGKSARDWILPHLHEMTQGHCAFCDAFPLNDRSNTPIEHFKPKSEPEFHHLAYDWENLYYCCEFCQTSKLEQWNELLLRPDESGYQFDSYFMFDFTTGELKPNCGAETHLQNRARVTIELYGLDSSERQKSRKLELRKFARSSERTIDDWAYRDFLELGHNPTPQI